MGLFRWYSISYPSNISDGTVFYAGKPWLLCGQGLKLLRQGIILLSRPGYVSALPALCEGNLSAPLDSSHKRLRIRRYGDRPIFILIIRTRKETFYNKTGPKSIPSLLECGGHLQPLHWLCRIHGPLPPMRNDWDVNQVPRNDENSRTIAIIMQVVI